MNQIQYFQKYDWLAEDVNKSLQDSVRSLRIPPQDLASKIQEIANVCIQEKLEKHTERKLANKDWFWDCMNQNVAAFPYRIAKSGKADILYKTFCYPENQNTTNPKECLEATPRFIVNIPEGRFPSRNPVDSKYRVILKTLKNESFSSTSSSSSRICKSRVAVVVGTNQVESLDPARNQSFVELIRKTDLIKEIACRRFGFLWRAEYCRKEDACKNRLLYPVKQAFYLLKVFSKGHAEKVRELVEEFDGKLHPHFMEQIPFQKIRQAILKSHLTRDFADALQKSAPTSPIYLTVMDADFLKLRTPNEQGLFTKVVQVIPINKPLSIIGCGYLPADTELPIIRLAVRLDMAVRAAMTEWIPYSAYLPEPFLCTLLCKPNQNHHLDQLSFLGRGQALESRRLIDNGRSRGVFDERMAFIANGLVTTSPERWKTEKNRSYVQLDKADIKRKEVLQALRGLSQSHIHPKKWADQVYAAIDFSCSRVTDATKPMMYIFGSFDPISRMFARQSRFTARIFDEEINSYNDPLPPDELKWLGSWVVQLKGLGMSQQLVDQVISAAQASGRAICEELRAATA